MSQLRGVKCLKESLKKANKLENRGEDADTQSG